VPPNRSWLGGPKCHATDIGPIFGEYPTALLPKEISHDGDKRIRALIVVGGNLATALSDPNIVLPALSRLDLLVTLDQRETATGVLSDYQIGISLPYERLDFNAILEYTRHISYGQIARPFMPRPDGVMEDWEFFTGLAGRMGHTMKFKRTLFSVSQADTPGPTYDVGPGDSVSAEDLIRFMVSQGRFSYDDLLANPHGIALPDAETEIAPAAPDAAARLDLCPEDVFAEIKALPRRAYDAGAYPYRLVSRRLLETVNSAYTQSSKARRRYPVNPVFMNPDDMDALGLCAKDTVLLESAHGRSHATVKPDKGLKPGVLAASHGWGRPDKPEDQQSDLFTGRLVSITEDITAINYMPRQSAIPVRVKPLLADAS
ncbi:MAG: molybdopterin dinucleotide binding domain-containing protein, partial [Pseudomonadota bacterium]